MGNPSLNTLSAIARVTPSLPQRGRQPKGASPLTPNFDLFFRCMFTAMLYGARVDRSRAPVAPSISNTDPYMFSPEQKFFHFGEIPVENPHDPLVFPYPYCISSTIVMYFLFPQLWSLLGTGGAGEGSIYQKN